MIQSQVTDGNFGNLSAVNIYDEVEAVTSIAYKPLWVITSQFTRKEKTFLPLYAAGLFPRSALFVWTTSYSSENLLIGLIKIGNTDYPLGFYDLEIYNNSSDTNLDKSGLTKLFTGLLNFKGVDPKQSVTYSEYTTNDADTESVYVTI